MNKLILIFILLLIIPISLGVNPHIQKTPANSLGLDIRAMEYDYIKLNNDFDFKFHVFNISDGVPVTNSTVVCYFHLYNQTGKHIADINPVTNFNHNFDWEVPISKNNFTSVGEYSAIFQCNKSSANIGGFYSFNFMVTNSGEDPTETNYGNIALIIGLIGLSFLFLYFGLNLGNDHFLLKLISILFSFISILFIPAVLINGYYNTSISLLKIVWAFFGLFGAYFAFYIGYYYLNKSEKFMSMFNKGRK